MALSTFERWNPRGLRGLRWGIVRYLSRGGSLPRGASRWRDGRGSSNLRHVGNGKRSSSPCSEGARSASFWSEMLVGLGIEWRGVRLQGGRGDSQWQECLWNEEQKKLGVGGRLKRNGRQPFIFARTSWVSHNVQNWFRYAKILQAVRIDFTWVGLFLHSLRTWFAGCANLVHRVCEFDSQGVQNEWLISHALRKFCKVCELFWLLLCLKSPCNRSSKNLS